MSAAPPLLVVCGLHRSGTTYLGELLKEAGVTVVHEPLNEKFGMADVSIAYPYAEYSSDRYSELVDDAVNFARPWNKDATQTKKRIWGRWIYRLTGGHSGLRWGGIRLRHLVNLPVGKICLKDPFMSLATPYLVGTHGVSAVCMVRHPAAIHYSTARQNWWFDIENLSSQSELIARYGSDIPEEHWELARKHAAASVALLWKFMVRINMKLAKSTPKLLVMTHEQLCLEPQDATKRIFAHFGLPFTHRLEVYVKEHSSGSRAEGQSGKVHDFTRNSRELPIIWKQKIDPADEKMIEAIAGEEIQLVYGLE